ncbi:hypothetical protein FOCC_FOCC013669 [Frankliniella occidentalis]|nr:hypothetical protein FOCC_FOCC013669 [Frankliniella occidentalis]
MLALSLCPPPFSLHPVSLSRDQRRARTTKRGGGGNACFHWSIPRTRRECGRRRSTRALHAPLRCQLRHQKPPMRRNEKKNNTKTTRQRCDVFGGGVPRGKIITVFPLICRQAILFYTPRWLWKNWEGGKIHALMMDLDIGICSEVEKKQKKKLLLDYLWENLRYHNWWAYRYYLCELLAFGNVRATSLPSTPPPGVMCGQMFLMDKFFDGAFLRFGIEVLQFMESDEETRIDPLVYVFPRMTKCTFHKFGPSGEVERHDAVCILPLNVVNEKIYVFLWFWFIVLGALSLLTVLYRGLIILSPRIRVYLLRLRYPLINRDDIDAIVRRSKMGDWFLLYMLGENVDSVIFRDVMHELAQRLGHHHQHHHHHHQPLGPGPRHHPSNLLETA